tara:strand:- start:19081 stop:20067 length:987 start_codon:yes stop_codon:yes gene_type:complete
MAVYTHIDNNLLSSLLINYNIGDLKSFEGIIEGVENTNYKIVTNKNKFILTIFEKRVNGHELPFFIELQKHLSSKKIRCPMPIADKSNNFINSLNGKKCVIMSFLEGKKIDKPNNEHCMQLGSELAKIHKNTKDFKLERKNTLHFSTWNNILQKCKESDNIHQKIPDNHNTSIKVFFDYFESIEKELEYLSRCWPKNLPKGVIHADAFKDNVFFNEDKLTGLIDFYFACNDFYAYELAICINDWCFDDLNNFQLEKYNNLLEGYQGLRKLNNDEINCMPILLRGAALRFLLTRLHDQLYHQKGALVTPKNPLEYFDILKTHQKMQIIK